MFRKWLFNFMKRFMRELVDEAFTEARRLAHNEVQDSGALDMTEKQVVEGLVMDALAAAENRVLKRLE